MAARPAAMLAEPAILFCYCRLYIVLFFFFFRRLISEVDQSTVTKLCHMFDGDPHLKQAVVRKHNKPRPRVAHRGIARFLRIGQKM